jgi:hypothetical protein
VGCAVFIAIVYAKCDSRHTIGKAWLCFGRVSVLRSLFIELRGAGPELVWWQAVKERFAPKPKLSRSSETRAG